MTRGFDDDISDIAEQLTIAAEQGDTFLAKTFARQIAENVSIKVSDAITAGLSFIGVKNANRKKSSIIFAKPLLIATQRGDLDMIKALLPFGDASHDESQLLRTAARAGNNKIVKLLLPHSNPTEGNFDSLHQACSFGWVEVTKTILESEKYDKSLQSAALICARNGNRECLSLLLNKEKELSRAFMNDILDIAFCKDDDETTRIVLQHLERQPIWDRQYPWDENFMKAAARDAAKCLTTLLPFFLRDKNLLARATLEIGETGTEKSLLALAEHLDDKTLEKGVAHLRARGKDIGEANSLLEKRKLGRFNIETITRGHTKTA